MTNTGHKASSHLICTQSAFTISAMISGAMSVMSVFSVNIESQRTLSVRYFTTLSHQMLTGIKHVADDKFCFQQDSILAHHACNTLKLQESELSASLLFVMACNLTAQQWSLLIIRFRDSYISLSRSCESTRLKNQTATGWSFVKQDTPLEWKDAILCFSVSQGSAETLFRWGGKINYSSIALSFVNVLSSVIKNGQVLLEL